MLRTAKSLGPKPETVKPWSLVVFSVGGKRLAARAEEVGGVWPWAETMPVPSSTPYINAILRRGEDILPVFDVATFLRVEVTGEAPFCLIARRQDGPMALRIDPIVPTLHMVEQGAIRPAPLTDPGAIGACSVGTEEVPVYSLVRLGLPPAGGVQQVA